MKPSVKPIMTGERRNAIDANGFECDPCSWCGGTKWRTITKGCEWQCRTCLAIRQVAEAI